MKKIMTLMGAALAAIAASACCILPAVLGVAGAGTLGVSAALTPYRPYFMALTVLLLGAAFYFVYRPAKGMACEDGQCATDKTASLKRGSKIMLWCVTLFTIGAMAYPEIGIYRLEHQAASAVPVQAVMASTATKTVDFSVGRMGCAECVPEIASALQKTPGVRDAKVDFKTKHAIVRYQPAQVSTSQIGTVITKLGYTVKESK